MVNNIQAALILLYPTVIITTCYRNISNSTATVEIAITTTITIIVVLITLIAVGITEGISNLHSA